MESRTHHRVFGTIGSKLRRRELSHLKLSAAAAQRHSPRARISLITQTELVHPCPCNVHVVHPGSPETFPGISVPCNRLPRSSCHRVQAFLHPHVARVKSSPRVGLLPLPPFKDLGSCCSVHSGSVLIPQFTRLPFQAHHPCHTLRLEGIDQLEPHRIGRNACHTPHKDSSHRCIKDLHSFAEISPRAKHVFE